MDSGSVIRMHCALGNLADSVGPDRIEMNLAGSTAGGAIIGQDDLFVVTVKCGRNNLVTLRAGSLGGDGKLGIAFGESPHGLPGLFQLAGRLVGHCSGGNRQILRFLPFGHLFSRGVKGP